MHSLVITFAVIGILFSTLGIALRLFNRNVRGNPAELLLGIALFAIMWQVFVHLMILTHQIVTIPNLYNKGIPLYYLVAPAFYFFIRIRLQLDHKLPKYWFIHLIPFFFGLIDILPYVFIGNSEKVAFLKRLIVDPRLGYEHAYGFIPQQFHYMLRLFLAFIYLIMQWGVLFMTDTTDSTVPSSTLKYLYFLTSFYTLFIAFQVGMFFNILFNRTQAGYILTDVEQLIWLSLLYVLLSLWICFGFMFRRTK